jgi:hypothetical protein
MRKHLWWLVPFTATLLTFGALVPLLVPRSCRVTRAAFERIEEGMTLAEVEKVLGGPPDDYRTRPQQALMINHLFDAKVWKGDELTLWVNFERSATSGEDVVRYKNFIEREPVKLGIVDTLLWRLEGKPERVYGNDP